MSPAVNESQRRLAGIALAMVRGETPKSYSAEAYKMTQSMSVKELREFARKPVER